MGMTVGGEARYGGVGRESGRTARRGGHTAGSSIPLYSVSTGRPRLTPPPQLGSIPPRLPDCPVGRLTSGPFTSPPRKERYEPSCAARNGDPAAQPRLPPTPGRRPRADDGRIGRRGDAGLLRPADAEH